MGNWGSCLPYLETLGRMEFTQYPSFMVSQVVPVVNCRMCVAMPEWRCTPLANTVPFCCSLDCELLKQLERRLCDSVRSISAASAHAFIRPASFTFIRRGVAKRITFMAGGEGGPGGGRKQHVPSDVRCASCVQTWFSLEVLVGRCIGRTLSARWGLGSGR